MLTVLPLLLPLLPPYTTLSHSPYFSSYSEWRYVRSFASLPPTIQECRIENHYLMIFLNSPLNRCRDIF